MTEYLRPSSLRSVCADPACAALIDEMATYAPDHQVGFPPRVSVVVTGASAGPKASGN